MKQKKKKSEDKLQKAEKNDIGGHWMFDNCVENNKIEGALPAQALFESRQQNVEIKTVN